MGTAATAAKARYNRKNYDNVTIRTRKGGNEAINELASLRRKSKSDYIRDLIRQDANRMRRPDLAQQVGSGNPDIIAPPPPQRHRTAIERHRAWLSGKG